MDSEDKQQGEDEGVVYILANPAMPDYVKIGFTKDLPERMRSLDQSSSVPFGFECLQASIVHRPRVWERVLHEVFSDARVNQRREFFESDVLPKAALILRAAQRRDVTSEAPSVASAEETPSESVRNGSRRERRERFNFGMLDIAEGEILTFVTPDENGEEICCLVSRVRPPRVIFEDAESTLAEATAKAFGANRSLSGLAYWRYKDETLLERRRRIEEESESEPEDSDDV